MSFSNKDDERTILLEEAVVWLQKRLPDSWSLQIRPEAGLGSRLALEAPGGFMGSILVEPRASLSPREASNLLQGFGQSLRTINRAALLVVAPWLSLRTREVLGEQGINYIDLTGNALIRLESPALYLESTGASQNPRPRPKARARLRGAKAARLIRLLADVKPPYGVRELAKAARVAPGYTSQLLETLYDDALVERSRRGRVEGVEVRNLIRRWARTYDVLRNNRTESYIAANGLASLLTQITEARPAGRFAITGSFAAVRMAPVAAPALLLAYAEDPPALARELNLLPADEGANVILMRPFDGVVWRRTRVEDELRFVAPPQAAVDCLTGVGRMPAEGEALLDWMDGNEANWRLSSLAELHEEGPDGARL